MRSSSAPIGRCKNTGWKAPMKLIHNPQKPAVLGFASPGSPMNGNAANPTAAPTKTDVRRERSKNVIGSTWSLSMANYFSQWKIWKKTCKIWDSLLAKKPCKVSTNTQVSRKCDFRRFYCRAGVSPAIERLTHAGETPALHSEVQKQAAFGITSSRGGCRRCFGSCASSVSNPHRRPRRR